MEENIIFRSFSDILKLQRLMGLYPPRKPSTWYSLRIYGLYFCLMIFMVILIFIKVVSSGKEDIIERNFMCMFLCQVSFCALKIIPFIVKRQRVRECIYYFSQDCFKPENTHEEVILTQCCQFCRKLCRTYLSLCFSAIVLWDCPSLVSKDAKLPLDVWLPYDHTSGFFRYYGTWFFVIVATFYNGLSISSFDPLVAGMLYYVVTHIRILKYNLTNLSKEINGGCISFSQVNNILRRCVTLHNNIFTFMRIYEDCFSWSFFCQLGGSMLSLCFCCIGLIMTPTSVGSLNFLKLILSFIIMTSEIFFYSYFGTLLLEENEGIANAIYKAPWYNYDIKIKQILIIIVERSKKPLLLTAGGFINLTLATFVSTLKTSYSLIAVLKKT